MPSEQAIRAGKAVIEIATDERPLRAGMARVRIHLEGLRTSARRLSKGLEEVSGSLQSGLKKASKYTTIAAASLAGFATGGVMAFARMGSEVSDLADQLGMQAEAWQELAYAGSLSGVSAENLQAALVRMQNTLADAREPTSGAAKALGQLGVTLADLQDSSPDEQFTRIAEALGHVADQSQRTALATEIFGRSGSRIAGMGPSLRQAREEARNLGLVMSNETVAAGDRLGDSLDRLKLAGKLAFAQIGMALEPVITSSLPRLLAGIKNIGTALGFVSRVAVVAFKGRLDLAFEAIKLGAELAWNKILEAFADPARKLVEMWLAVQERISAGLIELWAAIKEGWANAGAFFLETWNTALARSKQLWASWKEIVGKGVLRVMMAGRPKEEVEAAARTLEEDMARERVGAEAALQGKLDEIRAEKEKALADINAFRAESLQALRAPNKTRSI